MQEVYIRTFRYNITGNYQGRLSASHTWHCRWSELRRKGRCTSVDRISREKYKDKDKKYIPEVQKTRHVEIVPGVLGRSRLTRTQLMNGIGGCPASMQCWSSRSHLGGIGGLSATVMVRVRVRVMGGGRGSVLSHGWR